MERNRHDPELIDEENDVYRCTKCGKQGKFKGDFYDDCISDDFSEPSEGSNADSLLRGIFKMFEDDLYDRKL